MGAAKDYLALRERAKAIDADIAVVLVAGGIRESEPTQIVKILDNADLPSALAALSEKVDDPAYIAYSRQLARAHKAVDTANVETLLADINHRALMRSLEPKNAPEAEETVDIEIDIPAAVEELRNGHSTKGVESDADLAVAAAISVIKPEDTMDSARLDAPGFIDHLRRQGFDITRLVRQD